MNEFGVLNTLAQNYGLGIWGLVLLGIIAFIKAWPAIGQLRINAAQQRADADTSIRADLMGEIRALRQEQREERAECDKRLQAQDEEINKLRSEIAGLHRMIAQHSRSSAMLMSEPGKVAGTQAARKRRGEAE